MKYWAYNYFHNIIIYIFVENMNLDNLQELLSGIFDNPYSEGNEDAYDVWGYLGDQTSVLDGPAGSSEVRRQKDGG